MSNYKVNIKENKAQLLNIIARLSEKDMASEDGLYAFLKANTRPDGSLYSKSNLIVAYKKLKQQGDIYLSTQAEKQFISNVKMKKVRTLSGVTPVTVLTKPFPCPGQCIFCPNDVRMPKSYLSDEPGAQRALMNKFDPYLQTFNRLVAFKNTGHSTDKIELLILGGTWSAYPDDYQIWFVKRCFDAMNDFNSNYTTDMLDTNIPLPFEEANLSEIKGTEFTKNYNRVISEALVPRLQHARELEKASWTELYGAHQLNESAKTRCIGMVIETRPDEISKDEVVKLRKLGATRVQIGIQSMNDDVLKKNKRGHDVFKTQEALNLLRQAGFKILAHWMPNLYGSSPDLDKKDFDALFENLSIKPDELKIYPCSLIESAELMKYYKDGLWKPYSHKELMDVVSYSIVNSPRYCRLNRVIRDIPSTDIVVGNKKTNFRQLAEAELRESLSEIRSREVKNLNINFEDLMLKETRYKTAVSEEIFIEYVTSNDRICGFLRLSLPEKENFIKELSGCSIIREIHVYGTSIELGIKGDITAQHRGLGKRLIQRAKELTAQHSFKKIAVISSVGTREYYRKNGFYDGDLYQICDIS